MIINYKKALKAFILQYGKDFDISLRLEKTNPNFMGLTGFDSKMNRFVSMSCFENQHVNPGFQNLNWRK